MADLVGDYLFTDKAFVQKLSTENRNVFQKIWDEIKYLCKTVTAGSKEARQLLEVKKAFEEAYRAETKNPTGDGGKLSISRTQDMSWDDQINGALYGGKNIRRNDTLVAGYSADTSVGSAVDSKPLAIPLSVLSKASSGKDISHSIKRDKLARLDAGIKNAPITIVNPARNAIVYVTDIKQGGLPIVAAFDMNTTFDGDAVHKATSIHLQVDVDALLRNLPETATVYVQKNELNPVGATNNLRGLAAKIKFIDTTIAQNTHGVNSKNSLSEQNQADTDSPFPLPWQIKGGDVALEFPLPPGYQEQGNAANVEELGPVQEDASPLPPGVETASVVNPDGSTGAAPSIFDPVSHLQYEYGSLPEGENAVREDSRHKIRTSRFHYTRSVW